MPASPSRAAASSAFQNTTRGGRRGRPPRVVPHATGYSIRPSPCSYAPRASASYASAARQLPRSTTELADISRIERAEPRRRARSSPPGTSRPLTRPGERGIVPPSERAARPAARGPARESTPMSALGFPVIDADGHVQELNIDWAARIAPAVRDRAPRVAADNRGFPRLLAEGKLWPKPEGRGTGQAGGPRSRRPTETTGMHDPVRRLQDMDLEGIDTAVLFGTSVFLSLPFFEDAELA